MNVLTDKCISAIKWEDIEIGETFLYSDFPCVKIADEQFFEFKFGDLYNIKDVEQDFFIMIECNVSYDFITYRCGD